MAMIWIDQEDARHLCDSWAITMKTQIVWRCDG